MHNWNIGVADMLTPKLTEQLNSMRDKLVANIDCNTARAEVAKLWAPRSIPVAIPNNGQVFVNVEPESIGFSGVQSTDTALDLALMISAKVSVDTSAETMAAKPLPALSRIPLAAGKIVIAVPLRASYVSLNQAIANAVKGKVHSTATPAGPVQVTIRDVEVYPSNGRLAVSISFSAQLPGHWLDTNGTVYLAGKPETEGNAQIIAITDLQFGRIVDNELWTLVSALFEKQIRDAIQKAARVDLTGPVAQGKEALHAKVAEMRQTTGVQVDLTNTQISAGPIVAAPSELIAVARFESVANVTVSALP